MKLKIAAVFIFALALQAVAAQTLVVGEKVPDFRVREWADMRRPMAAPHRMMLVEFFHSSNQESVNRLAELNRLAKQYAGGLTVIVITKEESPEVAGMLRKASALYYIGTDDNSRTFTAFGVQYVPYAVLIDPKGRLLWMGNSTTMTADVIENNLEHGIYKDGSLRKTPQGTKR